MLVSHLEDLARDFRLFDLILGLTALLAALGVLNGLLLSALERTKELGVLRALGASRRQIAGMVLAESAIVGILGGLLGTALGAVLTPVIVRALEALSGLDLPNVTAGWWLVWVPVGAHRHRPPRLDLPDPPDEPDGSGRGRAHGVRECRLFCGIPGPRTPERRICRPRAFNEIVMGDVEADPAAPCLGRFRSAPRSKGTL